MSFNIFSVIFSILDRILFRIIPGFCFLWQILGVYAGLDEKLRPSGGALLILLNLVFVVTIATQVVWVLAGDEVFVQRIKKFGRPNIVVHALGFIANCLSLFVFYPPENWWKFLVISGTVYTVGTFLAEMLLVLPSIIQSLVTAISSSKWREALYQLFLGILMLGVYFPPVGYVLYRTTIEFSTFWGVGIGILCVLASRWTAKPEAKV